MKTPIVVKNERANESDSITYKIETKRLAFQKEREVVISLSLSLYLYVDNVKTHYSHLHHLFNMMQALLKEITKAV